MENILSGVVLANDERMVTVDVAGKPVEAISDYGRESPSWCLSGRKI